MMVKITHHSIIYIIICVLLVIGLIENVVSQPVYNAGTGHYYMRYEFNETINPVNASQMCDQKYHNGMQGYLVTWNNLEEWNWANAQGIVVQTPQAWISGTDLYSGVDGIWYYSSGPEKYQLIYNLFFDKCYTACVFGPVEPNLIPGEHYLLISYTNGKRIWNNNGFNAGVKSMICEFGGLEDPFIAPAATSGGEILITNIIGYDIATLVVTFTKLDITTAPFQCQSVTMYNSTAATCILPPDKTGNYSVEFRDATGKNATLKSWQYQIPYISSIYPNYNSGEIITITGQNFGGNQSMLSVTVSQLNYPCTNIIFLKPNEAFTCVLSTSLTGEDKLLPINIVVDGISYTSFKAAVYFNTNRLFYSGFIASATYTTSTYNYSAELRVDGQVGHAAVVNTVELHTFFNKTLPLPSNSVWKAWTGARYDSPTQSYIYNQGPSTGTQVDFYLLQQPVVSGWNSSINLFYFLYNATLDGTYNPSTAGATLVEYGGFNPSFQSNTTNYVDTEGGPVPMYLDNYGTQFSTVLVTYNNTVSLSYTRDFIQGQLSANVTPGINGPYPISVTIDGTRSTAPNTQFIRYNPPNIDIATMVSTNGGFVTFTGTSFSSPALGNATISFSNGVTCSDSLQYLIPHRKVGCSITPYYGNINVTIKVGNQVSQPFQYQYLPPFVQSTTNFTGSMNGTITITGNGFYTNPSLLKVTLGSNISCTNIRILIAHTTIECYLQAGSGTHPINVTIGQIYSSNTDVLFTFPTPTISSIIFDTNNPNIITIMGNNFSPTDSNVELNGVTLPNSSIILRSTDRVVTYIPRNTRNGQIVVYYSGMISPPAVLVVKPYITSISSPYTQGSLVSIQGYFLSNTDSNNRVITLNVKMTYKSIETILPCPNNYFLWDGYVECLVPRGVEDFTVNISNSVYTSNTVQVAYSNPVVESSSSLYYKQGGLITIQGDSFGTNGSLSVLVGNSTICPNVVLLDDRHIECYYDAMIPPPADNISSIDIQVTTTSFGIKSGSNQVFLYLTDKLCPNNCSNHGQCQTGTGECICDTGYTTSIDCSIPNNIPVPDPPVIDPNNGNVHIPSGLVSFGIAISHLREVSIVGDVLKTISMSNIKWKVVKVSSNQYYCRGNFSTDPVIVETYVTYYNHTSNITFAGEPFIMPPNSMKYEITVSNWQWSSTLGQLQVIYNSKTAQEVTDCEGTTTSTSLSGSSTSGDQLYYFQIKNGESLLNAKFSSRMYVDGRVVRSRVIMLDRDDPLYIQVSNNNTNSNEFNLLTAIITTHFSQSVKLDPSFSSLLVSEPVTECKEPSKVWKLVLIIVLSSVGGIAIVVAAIIGTKRYLNYRAAESKLMSKLSSLK